MLITADQWRGDYLGLAGNNVVRTPNIDAFVNHGVYFPNAYSEVPSTTAAHRMMLTGTGSYECGLVGYTVRDWNESNTVPQALADSGYHCIRVGWCNVKNVRQLYGFHKVVTGGGRAPGESDYDEWLKEEVGPEAHPRAHGCDANGWLARPFHLPERYHQTNWAIARAIDELKRRDPTRPFFMWIALRAPHSPYDPPQHYWDIYMKKNLPKPVIGDWADEHDVPVDFPGRITWRGRLPEDYIKPERAGYMGLCTHIDFQIGYLMERMGHVAGGFRVLDNTFILFHSDHGDMLGDHNLHRKTYAYEASANIPFVIRYPKGLDAPTGNFDEPIGLQDIGPTLLDVAGVDKPDYCSGCSVLKATRGEDWREFIHGEHSPCYNAEQSMQYLTDGRQKYVWFPLKEKEQLFDLESDPQELWDLAGDPDWSDTLQMWRQRLIEILSERPDGLADGERLVPQIEPWGPVSRK